MSNYFTDERILYDKLADTERVKKWKGKYVAIRNPFNGNEVLVRKVIAVPGQWVQRKDDGGLIKIPN